ncbi:MAG: hypothetical protein ABL866_08770 [Devosia sp.]
MDIFINLLFWVHMVALAVGGSASFGLFAMRPFVAKSSPETREKLFSIEGALSRNGMIALGLLFVSGPLLIWARFGGFGALSVWFWVKMGLIAVQIVAIAMAGRAGRRLKGGDLSAAPALTMASNVSILAFLLVILSAVFAFE